MSLARCRLVQTRNTGLATLLLAAACCWVSGMAAGPVSAQESGPAIDWQEGPCKAAIGNIAEIQVPEGFQFTGASGTQTVLQILENPVAGNELGLMMPLDEDVNWFIVFEFDDCGYVKDDEKDELDADAILKSIREGNDRANEERRRRGWSGLEIVGWEKSPAYDPQSNNLEWAIRGQSEGESVVNYNTRLLGRTGVMSANLVVDPSEMSSALPQFQSLLNDYTFQTGKKYSEFRSGDKIAKYGLTALVTGGVAAVALKAGLFKKFWKLIVFAVIAVGDFFKKIFSGGSK